VAHFAEINEDNIVVQVILIANEDCLDNGIESEEVGISFCSSLLGGRWIQTSYNATFRKNYAGIGFKYDPTRDAFIPPQPFPSWLLSEDTCQWSPPVERPLDGLWVWDEELLNWSEFTPPDLG
jgi:hypothetical protein